jgi:hypothetical protein
VTDTAGSIARHTITVSVTPQLTSSISGYVYFDMNNNGVKEPSEWVLPNIPVTLDGSVSRTVTTDTDGFYRFDQLSPGTYGITQTQPRAYRDGQTSQGTPPLGFVENNRFYGIELPANVHATDYNFGELGLRSDLISKRLLIVPPPPGTPLYSETVIRGQPWYAFDVTAEGWVTVTLPTSVSNPIIELYTRSFMPVAIVHGQHQLWLAVQQGDQFTLHTDGQTDGSGFDVTLRWSPQPPAPAPVYHTNPDNALDVNGDGIVSALDALIVINALNLLSLAESAARSGAGDDYYLDVDGNGLLTAADALMVINHLNARPMPGGSVGGQGAMGATDWGSAALAEHGAASSPVRWIHDGDGWWDEPAKWSTGAVPGADDDVIIDRPGGVVTVTVRPEYAASARSLQSARTWSYRATHNWCGRGVRDLGDAQARRRHADRHGDGDGDGRVGVDGRPDEWQRDDHHRTRRDGPGARRHLVPTGTRPPLDQSRKRRLDRRGPGAGRQRLDHRIRRGRSSKCRRAADWAPITMWRGGCSPTRGRSARASSPGTGAASVSAAFENQSGGIVELNAGTLQFWQDLTNAGTVSIGADTHLKVSDFYEGEFGQVSRYRQTDGHTACPAER